MCVKFCRVVVAFFLLKTAHFFPSNNNKIPPWLNGTRIAFIGDSTMRYQYLTLAYFLEHGEWPDTSPNKPSILWEGSVSGSKLYRSNGAIVGKAGCNISDLDSVYMAQWTQFYQFTNSAFGEHEKCDCYRSNIHNSIENRLYSFRNVSLAYFQYFGDCAWPRGTSNFQNKFNISCRPGMCCRQRWEVAIGDFLSSTLNFFQPTHVILNLGLWKTPHKSLHCRNVSDKKLIRSVNSASSKGFIRSSVKVWRTTPLRSSKQRRAYGLVRATKVKVSPLTERGWSILDAFSHVNLLQRKYGERQVFVDHSHLSPMANVFCAKILLRTLSP